MADRNHDPYVYPGTDVLKNKLGIQDNASLSVWEANFTTVKTIDFLTKPLPKKITFGHLLSIHEHLFSEIYTWAGTPRSVDIHKGSTTFCRSITIQREAEKICELIESQKCFKGMTQQDFVAKFAHAFNEMNVVHPFREGNGRTTRLFFNQVAAKAGWQIDYGKISRSEWNAACIDGYNFDLSKITELFDKSLVPFTPVKTARLTIAPLLP